MQSRLLDMRDCRDGAFAAIHRDMLALALSQQPRWFRPLLRKSRTLQGWTGYDHWSRAWSVALGGCGINQINRIHRFGNLGYWVRSSQTGRGVAASAVALLARFAFQNTDLIRLEIVCAVGNHRSQRAAEKAGARREGILRDRLLLRGTPHDAVMYSMVKTR